MSQIFNHWDRNQNGTIEKSELKHAFTELTGIPVSESDLAHAVMFSCFYLILINIKIINNIFF
jgi:Ca2+-binding EF-hand superfamily protein